MANNNYISPYSPLYAQPNYGRIPGGYVPGGGYGPPTRQQQQSQGFDMPSLPGSNSLVDKATGGAVKGITTAVDSFGTNLGFASGQATAAPSATFMGPMPAAEGSLFGTATLSGALSGAGIGAAIGAFNPLAKNKTGGAVGGAIGGAIGNMILPGIGGFIGGALGSTLGGMFGSTPHPASHFEGKIGGDTGLTDLTFGAKHIDKGEATNVSGDFGKYVSALKQAHGIDLTGTAVFGGVDDGKYFIRTNTGQGALKGNYEGFENDKVYNFSREDAESRLKAYQDFVVDDLKAKEKLTPEIEAQIRAFRPMESSEAEQGTMAGGYQNYAGPMVNTRQPSTQKTFAQFLTEFRGQQNAGAA
jgi:hypothetical protein